MKRSISLSENHIDNHKMKKIKPSPDQDPKTEDVLLNENLLYEILKHVDARTLGAASCVNKRWNVTAQDERLWELICTQHWTNMSCGNNQLRSVVLALGGFRRLHAHYLHPLSKPSTSKTASPSSSTVAAAAATSRSAWPCLAPARSISLAKPSPPKTRWGKDEVYLSLSLLTIRYYEKMDYNNRNK